MLDPRIFSDEIGQILAVVYNRQDVSPSTWTSALEISNELRNSFGIDIHWRHVDSLLADGQYVSRKKKGGRWLYVLLESGKELLSVSNSSITLVDPTNATQSVVALHDFLGSLTGDISVCDPYLDHATLEHLDSIASRGTIRLLTHQIRDTGRLRQMVAAFAAKGQDLEIKQVTSRILHDRYLIDNTSMLILGTSLNGFGKKQSFITSAGEDIRATMIAEFNSLWNAADQWP